MMTDEQWHIQRFLESKRILPAGNVIYRDKPDALIEYNNKLVSLEHTRVLRKAKNGVLSRSYETLTNEIVDLAQKIAESRNIPPLHVFLHFEREIKLPKNEIEFIANDIANLVVQYCQLGDSEIILEKWKYKIDNLPFPKYVKRIGIYKNATINQQLWQFPRVTSVESITHDIIREKISIKEKKFNSYRLDADEIWLLLVLEGFSPSGEWSIREFDFSKPIKTKFDNVFLFDLFSKQSYKLFTSAT